MNPILDANHPLFQEELPKIKPAYLRRYHEAFPNAPIFKQLPDIDWNKVELQLDYADVYTMTKLGQTLKRVHEADKARLLRPLLNKIIMNYPIIAVGNLSKDAKAKVNFTQKPKNTTSATDSEGKYYALDGKKANVDNGVPVSEQNSPEYLSIQDVFDLYDTIGRIPDLALFVAEGNIASQHPPWWGLVMSEMTIPIVPYKAIDGTPAKNSRARRYMKSVFRKRVLVSPSTSVQNLEKHLERNEVELVLNGDIDKINRLRRDNWIVTNVGYGYKRAAVIKSRQSGTFCGVFYTDLSDVELFQIFKDKTKNAYAFFKRAELVEGHPLNYIPSVWPTAYVLGIEMYGLPRVEIINKKTPTADDWDVLETLPVPISSGIKLQRELAITADMLDPSQVQVTMLLNGAKGVMKSSTHKELKKEFDTIYFKDGETRYKTMLYIDEDIFGKLLMKFGLDLEGLENMTLDELNKIEEEGESLFEHEMAKLLIRHEMPMISKTSDTRKIERIIDEFRAIYEEAYYDSRRENMRKMCQKILTLRGRHRLVIIGMHQDIDVQLAPGARFLQTIRPPMNPEASVIGRKRVMTYEGIEVHQELKDNVSLMLQMTYIRNNNGTDIQLSLLEYNVMMRNVFSRISKGGVELVDSNYQGS